MKVLLLQDVPKVGKKGDIETVSGGYGKNFLVKKSMAVIATPEVIAKNKASEQKKAEEKQILIDSLNKMKAYIEKQTLVFVRPKSDIHTMRGSVSKEHIMTELQSVLSDIEFDKKKMSCDKIKTWGDYTASLNLGEGVSATISIKVNKE